MFPTFAAMVEENDVEEEIRNQIISAIEEHLTSLNNELVYYVPDVPDTSFSLVRKPFQIAVNDIPEFLQEEFIDMINDDTIKTEFSTLPLNQFTVGSSAW